MECILCGKSNLRIAEKISVPDLCRIYKGYLRHDISGEFHGLKSLDYVICEACGLRFFHPLVTGAPTFYDALSRTMGPHYYQEDKSEYRTAGSFIAPDDHVLDVGSGRGMFSRYVQGRYTGLDFNPVALEQAAKDGVCVLNESIEDHAAKLTKLYSVVTAFQVLEHMAEPRRFINSCLSILRPGGLLVLSVPSEDSFIAMQENAILNMPPHHVSRWGDRPLLGLTKLFNLTLVALEHEKLEQIHFEPFIFLLSNITVRTLLRWNKDEMIDVSPKKRIVDVLSKLVKPLYSNIYSNKLLWPKGHSVTVVFRKNLHHG